MTLTEMDAKQNCPFYSTSPLQQVPFPLGISVRVVRTGNSLMLNTK